MEDDQKTEEEESGFEEEIDDILTLGGESGDESTEGEEEEEQEEQEESDEEDSGDDDSDKEESEESEETDEGVDDEETDDDDNDSGEADLKTQNQALLARIQALEGAKPEAKETVEDKESDASEGEIAFLSDDDDIDEILEDRDKLNAFAVKIYKQALTDAGAGVQSTMQNYVPEAVVAQVQNQLTLREGINEFFKENDDLLPVRKTVGAITNEVVAEHDDWTLDKVLTEAGKRTREVLHIKKPKTKTSRGRKRNPALGGGSGGRKRQADNRSVMQKEIDDII